MESIYPLDLRSSNADDILDQFPDDWNHYPVNLFPNLPGVREMLSPYIFKENHFWIVTWDVPISLYTKLEDRNLVPYSAHYETHEQLAQTFYNSKPW